MRIVHVEDFIHPDTGYQVNTLSRLQVQQGHEVIIVTSELDKIPDYLTGFFGKENIPERDARFYKLTGAKIIRVPIMGFYSGRAIHYPKLFKTVDSLKPDVAFIHGEDTLMGMQFILRSSRMEYPIVLDCHSVEMSSINRFRKLFRIFFRIVITPKILKNKIPLIRVVDVDYVQKFFGIPLEYTTLLSFGTDTEYFKPDVDVRKELRRELGIDENTFLVIYAGKLDDQKGGLFLAESILEKFSTQSGKEIRFLIIGNAIGNYGRSVEKVLSKSENRIFRYPTQSFFELAKFYQSSDLAIFPRQCSLSFFEVQSCGLPVLFENNEVNIQRINYQNGFIFKSEDTNDFRSMIIKCADMKNEYYNKLRINARKYILDNFDYVPVSRKFNDVLENEVIRFKTVKKRIFNR